MYLSFRKPLPVLLFSFSAASLAFPSLESSSSSSSTSSFRSSSLFLNLKLLLSEAAVGRRTEEARLSAQVRRRTLIAVLTNVACIDYMRQIASFRGKNESPKYWYMNVPFCKCLKQIVSPHPLLTISPLILTTPLSAL